MVCIFVYHRPSPILFMIYWIHGVKKLYTMSLHDLIFACTETTVSSSPFSHPLSKGPRKYQPGPVVLEQFDSSEAPNLMGFGRITHQLRKELRFFSPTVVWTCCCCYYWSSVHCFLSRNQVQHNCFSPRWLNWVWLQPGQEMSREEIPQTQQSKSPVSEWKPLLRFMLPKRRNWIAGFFTAGGPWRWKISQPMSCFNTIVKT